jgi:hypothetical protein
MLAGCPVPAGPLGAQTPFYISSAELEFARSHPDSFALYRVYDATEDPKFYALEGDITLAVDLAPVTYRAQLASSAETTYGEALPTITPEDFP